MRVCYIAKSSIPSPYANAIQVMKMCAAFAGCGAQTELILPWRPRDWWRAVRQRMDPWAWYAVPQSFRLTRVPYPYPGRALHRRSGGLTYGLVAALYAASRHPDLVYTRHPWAAYWLSQWGQPVLLEAHNPPLEMAHPAFPLLLAHARSGSSFRGVVAISQGAASAYLDAGVPAAKVRVLHDGVDLERFDAAPSRQEARQRLGLPGEGNIVGHVGHLYEGRGADLVLQCAAHLPQVLFLFVGGLPADVGRRRAVSADLGLTNVRFVGLVPNGDMPTYLAAADVLAMPYTTNTPTVTSMSPLKMFEYMAAGRPIVASDLPTIREVLRHEHNALLVEPDRAETLLVGLRRALADTALAERIAGQARRDVEPYSWANRAAHILDWFAQRSAPVRNSDS